MNRDPRQGLTEWVVLAAQKESDAAFTDLDGLWQADLRWLALGASAVNRSGRRGGYRCLVDGRPRTEAAR